MFLRTRLGVYSPASVTGTGTAVLPKDIRARHEAIPSLEGWGAPGGLRGGSVPSSVLGGWEQQLLTHGSGGGSPGHAEPLSHRCHRD